MASALGELSARLLENQQAIDDLLLALPQPPMEAAQFPEYAVQMHYSTLTSPDTLPVEYFNIPRDAYIKLWPKPECVIQAKAGRKVSFRV